MGERGDPCGIFGYWMSLGSDSQFPSETWALLWEQKFEPSALLVRGLLLPLVVALARVRGLH
jgi:hypothetical protein